MDILRIMAEEGEVAEEDEEVMAVDAGEEEDMVADEEDMEADAEEEEEDMVADAEEEEEDMVADVEEDEVDTAVEEDEVDMEAEEDVVEEEGEAAEVAEEEAEATAEAEEDIIAVVMVVVRTDINHTNKMIMVKMRTGDGNKTIVLTDLMEVIELFDALKIAFINPLYYLYLVGLNLVNLTPMDFKIRS